MHLLTDVESLILVKLRQNWDSSYPNKYEELLEMLRSMDEKYSNSLIRAELQTMVEDILSEYNAEDLARFFNEVPWAQSYLSQGSPPRRFMIESVVMELLQRITHTISMEAYQQINPQLQAA